MTISVITNFNRPNKMNQMPKINKILFSMHAFLPPHIHYKYKIERSRNFIMKYFTVYDKHTYLYGRNQHECVANLYPNSL